jgi:hypothetical protein
MIDLTVREHADCVRWRRPIPVRLQSISGPVVVLGPGEELTAQT